MDSLNRTSKGGLTHPLKWLIATTAFTLLMFYSAATLVSAAVIAPASINNQAGLGLAVAPTAVYVNHATVSSDLPDPNPANNDAVLTLAVGPSVDTDGDGIPDNVDLDSDNDSIPDALER